MLGRLLQHIGRSPQAKDRLYFFHVPGCPACAQARPVVAAFRAAHPEVEVLSYDITTVDWRAQRWSPEVTPTLVHLGPDGKTWAKYDGRVVDGGRVIDNEEMKAWLARQFP